MTNEGASKQLGRLDKQLRRMEDRLAPPKQTEAERRRVQDLMAALNAGRRRAANASRARRGLEPLPEPLPLPELQPYMPSPRRTITIHDLMANLNEGRARCAAEKKKRDAEAERVKREAEAKSQGRDPNDLRE